MANLIATDRARLIAGTQVLLDDVSLGVLDGERIGVLGRNGGGKTSLLAALLGTRELDAGRVLRPAGVTSGMLAQADILDPDATVREVVLGDLAEHEWAGDPRVREILTGLLGDLGASALGGLDSPVGAKSGGELRRLTLAALLVSDPDLLLLDEPTNHLDVEGVAWLAAYLSQRRPRPGSGLIFVTHDRWFLDAVATRTWEVSDGQVHSYDGGYGAYVLARAERSRVAAVTEERRNNLLRKELAWLQRGAPARTSKPRFRIDAAEALVANEPPPRDSVELVRFATTRLGKDVFDLVDATVQLGNKVLLDDVTWRIGPGDRFGIVGVNGAGKSTLFRALMGQIPLQSGTLKTGKTVRLACLSQDLRELEAVTGRTVIDAITEVRSFTILGGKEISASQLATRLGFTGGRQQSRVGDLSGGERRRLQFLRLLMDEPNVLMLDEPTNDLDIDTLTSMEDVLDGWAGTLLVVSHDRYLLERMTDRQVALLGDGALRDLPGGVDQYLQLRRAMAAPGGSGPARSRGAGSPSAAASNAAAPSAADPKAAGPSAAELREARKTVARVEKSLARLGEREARVHEEMAAQATDAGAMTRLSGQLAEIHDEREALELEWLEAAELVD
ncbi:ATP-binding cassette domain-containing protein [Ornithinimicrobium faecis]|uniref:ATP-binding cassette domain-containing protein n=1 Tax=Ornithinimicrobium faecis TaxID=2934158 RepID=A0ABY4YRR5_9MICO|nr:ABC-F family ATP-binding cassette domain-containing protein [Ornithinimicrobium sp. HY1793]USQ79468.1 ATP-binding cassette domain-containing protein [Ornithinimicrobium sp. HY1793]